ncbi:MAG: Na/Pi cotransporter family protein [Kiritimatiellae bacterium]|nr:Na/Pi cotransporter family protein [Kiritimatiellia bacterium]
MTCRMAFEMLSYLIGGLSVFLLGMKNMSEGMQAVAGERLRKLIASVTDNRLVACGVGTSVTCLIQSSSVTTVMVVGLVNAGFMTLRQSIGVILGAAIGTTITAWIVALNILELGLPVLGISGFFFLFSKNERVRYASMMCMGLGMVFFGLLLMKNGVQPLRTLPEFQTWFTKFSADSYWGIIKCVLVGASLTAIVQSSSATVGITMVLAGEGVIPFGTALALVVGENIGTTITAYLASLGASTNAKRAAYAHILVKVVGGLWAIPLLPFLVAWLIDWFGLNGGAPAMVNGNEALPPVKQAIACFHTGFNIINVALFLPFVPFLARVLPRIWPDKAAREVPHLTYLDVRMLDTPAIGIHESHNEIVRMAEGTQKMMGYLKDIMTSPDVDEQKEKKVFHREEVLDTVQKEVVEFLSNLLAGSVSHDVMNRGRIQLRMADEYESISDYIVNILKLHLRLRKANLRLSTQGRTEILALHDRVAEYMVMVDNAVRDDFGEIVTKARTHGDMITHFVKEYRDQHLTRLANDESSPLVSLVFTDMLNSYRRIRDHALNIAEAVAGEK